MNIFKKLLKRRKEEETHNSIVYNSEKDVYKLIDSQEIVGIFIGNSKDYFNIMAGDTKDLIDRANKEFGMNEKTFHFNCTLKSSDITGIEELIISVSISKYTNDLPYGVFQIKQSGYGDLCFKRMPIEEKKPILNNPLDLSIYLDELKAGSSGRKNKKGILLYGPPGLGKTTAVFDLRKHCTDATKTRMFFVSPSLMLGELNELRDIFTGDYVIFVFEEVTERITRYGAQDILTFLDGENSWNNSLSIATTNYPEDLESNIVDRPGRLDTFIEFKFPTNEDIDNLAKNFGFEDGKYLYGRDLSYDYLSFIFDQCNKKKEDIKTVYDREESIRKKISETFKSKRGMGI